jgi:putative membrane protein
MRGTFGGVLMGLANLVPGISGGTMLLAAGIYEPFVNGVAEVTTGKLRFRSLVLLASVVGAAGLGILLLAGLLKELVVQQRWAMYSLFIGLTLGGLPIVLRMVRPITPGAVLAAVVAFALMAVLAVLQALGIVGSFPSNMVILFASGLAGASAMILPGLSGGYLLLLLGQYVPILSAIDQFKEALRAGDLSTAIEPGLSVMLPVGIGVLIGVVAVSNVLNWLLHHHRKATLGVLIGLLLGSVVGLWPFQTYVKPTVGETVIKGQLVTAENVADFDREDWPTQWFRPSLGQVAASLTLIGLGLGITLGVAALGGTEDPESDRSTTCFKS